MSKWILYRKSSKDEIYRFRYLMLWSFSLSKMPCWVNKSMLRSETLSYFPLWAHSSRIEDSKQAEGKPTGKNKAVRRISGGSLDCLPHFPPQSRKDLDSSQRLDPTLQTCPQSRHRRSPCQVGENASFSGIAVTLGTTARQEP